MLNINNLPTLLSEVVDGLKYIYDTHLVNVILFGSYARGDFDKDSDIDIAVILDYERGQEKVCRTKVIELSTELDLKFDILTSIRCIPVSEYIQWKDSLPFYQNIQNEGIVLL